MFTFIKGQGYFGWVERKTNPETATHQSCWIVIALYRFSNHKKDSQTANLWFAAGIVSNLRKHYGNRFLSK